MAVLNNQRLLIIEQKFRSCYAFVLAARARAPGGSATNRTNSKKNSSFAFSFYFVVCGLSAPGKKDFFLSNRANILIMQGFEVQMRRSL